MDTSDLTIGIDGAGVVDVLMTTVSEHLQREWEANRIVGNDYTQAYMALIANSLQTGATFVTAKMLADAEVSLKDVQELNLAADRALVEAKTGQVAHENDSIDANTALTDTKRDQVISHENPSIDAQTEHTKKRALHEVQQTEHTEKQTLQTEKQTLQIQKQTLHIVEQTEHTEADTVRLEEQTKVITEEIQTTINKAAQIAAQTINIQAETANIALQDDLTAEKIKIAHQQHLELEALLALKDDIQQAELDRIIADTDLKIATALKLGSDNLVSQQNILKSEQEVLRMKQEVILMKQRVQTEIAQICDLVWCGDNPLDNPQQVSGVIGKQKALYTEQAAGYGKDAKIKMARLYTDIAAIQYNNVTGYPAGLNGLQDDDIKTSVDLAAASVT